jgi:transcriptional regulator with XRE-family HTH domain
MTGEQIKALRAELGCTARELATALGVGQDDVLAWERGDRFATKRHVDAMAKLRAAGPGAVPRKPRKGAPVATSPMKGLADPELWRLLRKLLAHTELRAAVDELAASYADPAD